MRLKYIDSAKGLCMLLILWGHIVTFYDPVALWGSSFKVSLFYLVTGYLLSLKSEGEIKKTPISKLLLASGVPYIFYSVLSLLMSVAVMIFQSQPLSFLGEKLLLTVSLSGISTLWFLPSIFFGRLLFERIGCFLKKLLPKLAFIMVTPFLLWGLSEMISLKIKSEILLLLSGVIIKALTAFWFIFIGSEGVRIMKKLDGKKTVKAILSLSCFIAGSAAAFFNKGIDFNNISFGTVPLLFFVCGVLCSFGLIGTLEALSEKAPLKITEFAGENSLFIMVTHLPLYIVPVVFLVFSRLIPGNGTVSNYQRALVVFAVVLIIEWVLILIKNKLIEKLQRKIKNEKVKLIIKYI